MLTLLLKEETALSEEDIARLCDVARQLPLMAELSGADVFIDCAKRDGSLFVAAQSAPSTVVSSYEKSVVGQAVTAEKEPAVHRAFTMKTPVRDLKAVTQEGRTVAQNAVPLLNDGGACIAVLIREQDVSSAIAQEKKFQSLARSHEEEDASLRSEHFGESDLLLREVHHRVKNNLQLIASILNLQSRRCENSETRQILQENVQRVLSISAIHDIMTRHTDDFTAVSSLQLLSQLRANLQSLSPDERVRITLRSDDIPLPADLASSVALVVNELVSNSLEHAFPEGTRGEISVSFAAGTLFHTLSVSDNGCGFDPSAPRRSLGLRIVESTVRDRLRGKLTIQSNSGGTRAAFDFKTE